ncbi:MAG: ABC-F family ATP-binding cassette domain-containing protein [Desulfobulbaceae bacterium]|nr:MAG: ABC-F family ATP-binding cassette domain-containing protein [Desulfobulbaceae bacterium]
MGNLITGKGLGKSYGARRLFRDIHLAISAGDRVGLVGPNGAGKSTLLRILCGAEEADEGQVVLQKFARVSYLAQADSFDEESSATRNLHAALMATELTEAERHTRVQTLLSVAGFTEDGNAVSGLSGGWRKRLAICRALLTAPDVLVLDEPTNHLDIEGILWLESLLCGKLGIRLSAYLVVSHDRRFLENCTNRVVEISAVYPDGLFQVAGSYSRFLEERADFLALQSQEEERLANKVRRETEWLRRGPKARATKARYRIEEAYRLQDELSQVRGRNRSSSTVQIDFEATGRKTRKLLEGIGLAKSYGNRQLFAGLDLQLSPGSRIGLLGRNGCGKSTLMQILAAAALPSGIRPDAGTLVPADGVRIVSFDQRRGQVDPEDTLHRALAPDGDAVVYMGRSLHVVSWAKKFLFRPDQLETPVGQLSGGEQARILIAALMRQPADILLLDEPTNDLDIPSLDILEESLQEFPGALVLVTHDRYLLDAVCDRILGFDGKGGVAWYADYEQWLDHIQEDERTVGRPQAERGKAKEVESGVRRKTIRLSYLEQREYDQIEDRIAAAELTQEELEQTMELPETIADPARLAECWQNLENIREEIDRLYSRWAELEEKKLSGGD